MLPVEGKVQFPFSHQRTQVSCRSLPANVTGSARGMRNSRRCVCTWDEPCGSIDLHLSNVGNRYDDLPCRNCANNLRPSLSFAWKSRTCKRTISACTRKCATCKRTGRTRTALPIPDLGATIAPSPPQHEQIQVGHILQNVAALRAGKTNIGMSTRKA